MPNPNGDLPAAFATTCEPGYYLNNGVCSDCGPHAYCINDTQYSCSSINYHPNLTWTQTYVNGVWDDPHAWDPSQCNCQWRFPDDTRTEYMKSGWCIDGPDAPETTYTHYNWCRPGYYATSPLGWGDWYTACAPCDNGPAHAYYTSYSTPSVMYAVESNCPWACDAGYGRVGDTCQPLLCDAGVTQLRVSQVPASLWMVAHTTPALAVGINGRVCYGNLAPGHGTGLNISVAGTMYHLE